jgi:RHS repeat-associated protein
MFRLITLILCVLMSLPPCWASVVLERVWDVPISELRSPNSESATRPDGSTVEIVYNDDGDRMSQRVVETNGFARVTRFLTDRNNLTGYSQVVEEQNSLGQIACVYSYGLDLISMERTNTLQPQLRFYQYDGHGTVRALTDAAGFVTDQYEYDAYGILIERHAANALGTLVPVSLDAPYTLGDLRTENPYLYCGEYFEGAVGTYLLRARMYQSTSGRFLNPDIFEGINRIPASCHKYLYGHADPVTNSDPTGYILFSLLDLAMSQLLGQILDKSMSAVNAGRYLAASKFATSAIDVYEAFEPGIIPHWFIWAEIVKGKFSAYKAGFRIEYGTELIKPLIAGFPVSVFKEYEGEVRVSFSTRYSATKMATLKKVASLSVKQAAIWSFFSFGSVMGDVFEYISSPGAAAKAFVSDLTFSSPSTYRLCNNNCLTNTRRASRYARLVETLPTR